ncbi:transposase [Pseudomonas sp. LTJR-52]|uniref:transposase n=1 Tax=Pseudomonas sp. LTJR-52 TaxID=2479392 RepID=UPI003558351A
MAGKLHLSCETHGVPLSFASSPGHHLLRQMHRRPSRPAYRKRNVIERLFSWFKEHRRIATRFEKLATALKS